ncbi:uncharacterized protein A1O9_03943 [Exophiala aquamarina CBS 119918]|uniref:Uncharacterized protein n=1 Tax=Exophiala aquamarina CBS 119918 TaxID=1182545 RepID=A0A072PG30_9EURO|nr:uncharacterized protein A1O9_03943 [Exophiala aquamarina CBS 119918]KEF59099.1 hypothetical protein A1O9_03943 [Exophiala aquamarina CBS 119918]
MLTPPPGYTQNFILKVITYPVSVINVFFAGGLLWICGNPSFPATIPVTFLLFISNIYLVAAPFVPSEDGQGVYNDLPYYLRCAVEPGVLAAGGIY